MARRTPYQVAHWMDKGVIHLSADVAIGATGAPTLTKNTSKNIKSIIRNSTGDYTITFGDVVEGTISKYSRLQCFYGAVLNATASAVIAVQPIVDSVLSAGTLEFVCSSATATAADPESGSTLKLFIIMCAA